MHHFLPKHFSLVVVLAVLAVLSSALTETVEPEAVDLLCLQSAELGMLAASALPHSLPAARQGLCAALPKVCSLCGFFAARRKQFAMSCASAALALATLASGPSSLWLMLACLQLQEVKAALVKFHHRADKPNYPSDTKH